MSRLNDLVWLRADRGDDARRIGLELCEAHEIMCGLQLCFRRIDLRLGSLAGFFRLIKDGARRPSLRQQCFLPFEAIAGLGQLRLSGGQVRLCGTQGVHLVLRF